MADAPAPAAPPRPKMSLLTIAAMVAAFWIMMNAEVRATLGHYTGFLLDPLMGFGGKYPILTILLAGVFVMLITTLLRHFTTDWLEMAKAQAYARHFQREFMKAKKENNTYRIKVLTEKQPEVMAGSQKLQQQQMKQMPLTMLVSIPVFAWILEFLNRLQYSDFATLWNPSVDLFTANGILFGSSVFPHWVLLQIALTVPLGLLVQRAMKYFAWRERWGKRHPEVHE